MYIVEFIVAAGLGFEPRLADPESAVLPLDDPAIQRLLYPFSHLFQPNLESNNHLHLKIYWRFLCGNNLLLLYI